MALRITLFILLTSTILLLAILLLQPKPNTTLSNVMNYDYSANKKTKPYTPVNFQEVTLDWQVSLMHQQSANGLTSLTETLGSGVCILDFNRDGWMDLFFVGGGGYTRHYGRKAWWHKDSGNRLLLNQQGDYFIDITKQAGLNESMHGMGCAAADFDNDQWVDLIITGVGKNLIYKNAGDSTFINLSAKSGIKNHHWSTSANVGDFNNDGLIDIYISNYILYKKGMRTFERASGFVTSDVAFDPSLYDPEPNTLYLNKGNFVFQDISQAAEAANPLGRSLGAKWVDLNNDNWLDLIVINDHNSPNQVLINQQGTHFKPAEKPFSLLEFSGAHDIVIGDFNNDNLTEFYITQSAGQAPSLIAETLSTINKKGDSSPNYSDHAWHNGLATSNGLAFTAWGAAAGDFNNDGFLDIFVANGIPVPDIDSRYAPQGQYNKLFINLGNGHFASTVKSHNQLYPLSSRSVVSADLNNDGILELIVGNNNNPMQIFENQEKNTHSWIGIDLHHHNNISLINESRIEIITDKKTINTIFRRNESFLSQSDPRYHIGLGDSTTIKKLTIYWRDGTLSSFNNIQPEQYISINKSSNKLTFFNKKKINPIHKTISNLNEKSLIKLSELFLKADPKTTFSKLLLIWHSGSAKTKKHILENIQKHWDSLYLSLVFKALNDKNIELKLIAINILKKYELEPAIAWLIPQLYNKNPQVQCAATNTFQHFFDEEESVIHRKALAISPLIKLLETGSEKAKICAAKALASAENKRALLPLIKLASNNKSLDVRIESIRSIGLIRDSSTIENLVFFTRDSSSEASIIATSLIALKRLNYSQLNALFMETLSFSPNNPKPLHSPVKIFNIIYFLLSHQDGLVFPKNDLQKKTKQLINADPLSRLISTKEEEQLTISKLNVIAAAKLSDQYQRVKSLTRHTYSSVRHQAFITLTTLNNPSIKMDLTAILTDKSFSEISRFLNSTKPQNKLPRDITKILIKQISQRFANGTISFDQINLLLENLPQQTAQTLLEFTLNKKLTPTQRLTLLNHCEHKNLSLTIPDNTSLFDKKTTNHNSYEIRFAYGNCFFNIKESYRKNHTSSQKNRLFLNQLLSDSIENKKTNNTLLLKASETDPIIAKTMLLNKIDTLIPEHRNMALSIFSKHNQIHMLENRLWQQLTNTHNKITHRLEAAIHLIPFREKDILTYLNTDLLNHTMNNTDKNVTH